MTEKNDKTTITFEPTTFSLSKDYVDLMERYGLIRHDLNENVVSLRKLLEFFLDYAKTPDPEKDLSLFYGLWILKQVPR
ncbi:MAG: hypothetical protein JW776_09140, partial [Candidatus Lokiarchaeota archaeon]|nr:hypothetical protein [Candidatus Lokiarchaeota archaeon]